MRSAPSPREPLPEAFSEPSCKPSCEEKGSPVKVHVKLQMNLFIHMKVHVKIHVKVHLKALPNGACCSDDLAAAHYRLAHAVPMVGLRPKTGPNQVFLSGLQPIFSTLWVFARFGWKN